MLEGTFPQRNSLAGLRDPFDSETQSASVLWTEFLKKVLVSSAIAMANDKKADKGSGKGPDGAKGILKVARRVVASEKDRLEPNG